MYHKLMIIYDFIRGYQPFYPPKFVPSWVKENLEQVFLPTSLAVREGVVRRHGVIQAWTLENWLAADPLIKSLAEEFITNLKEASQRGFLKLGASAYANALLPLLSDQLAAFAIRKGVGAAAERIDLPTWFWFPDGVVDRRTLKILHQLYPELAAVIPDGCLGKTNGSGFAFVEYEDGSRSKVIIFNTLLKFLFLDSYMYAQKPPFIPKGINFDLAAKMAYDGKAFLSVLKGIGEGKEEFVLAREWENKTSRDGLVRAETRAIFEKHSAMEISSFINPGGDFEFKLFAEDSWREAPVYKISQVRPFCWEPFAAKADPYPLWLPANLDYLTAGQKAVIESWKVFLDTCNRVLSDEPKEEYLPLLISDIPWNVLAPAERKPDPMFAKRMLETMFVEIVEGIGNEKLLMGLDRLRRAVEEYVEESYSTG